MTKEEIAGKIIPVLAEEFEVEESVITPEAVVKETLAIDSLSLVDLVALIDYTFHVKVPVADLPSIKTFDDLYVYIQNHEA